MANFDFKVATPATLTTAGFLFGATSQGAATPSILTTTFTGTGSLVCGTAPSLTTPALGVATATSLAVNGATIGSNALAVTGLTALSSTLTITQGTADTKVIASTGYSVTGSGTTSMVDLAGTWNTSGAPTAIKLNVTDTASAATALLLDLQNSGTSRFRVVKNGSAVFGGAASGSTDPGLVGSWTFSDSTFGGSGVNPHPFYESSVLARSGTASMASYTAGPTIQDAAGATSYGHYVAFQAGALMTMTGTCSIYYGVYDFVTVNTGTLTNKYSFYSADCAGTGTITNQYGLYVETLTKGATNNYAIWVNGANASRFGGQILGAAAGAASTPPLSLTGAWFSGGSATTTKPQLLVEASGATTTGWNTAGTGLGINAASGFTGYLLNAQLNGVSKLFVTSGGNATLVGQVTASDFLASSGGAFYWNSRSIIYSPSNGVIELTNASATDFSRLQFGGTTSSFPSLKRSSTALQVRLADDSAYAPFSAELVTVAAGTATPAAGSTAARLLFGTTSGFGIYYGSGAPTVSAAQGSIYLRSDGTGIADRMYVNSNGSTTWTNFVTAA